MKTKTVITNALNIWPLGRNLCQHLKRLFCFGPSVRIAKGQHTQTTTVEAHTDVAYSLNATVTAAAGNK